MRKNIIENTKNDMDVLSKIANFEKVNIFVNLTIILEALFKDVHYLQDNYDLPFHIFKSQR